MPEQKMDVLKTGFRTSWGSHEYLAMPFGVTDAPPYFMHLFQNILHEYLDNFVISFVDDILMFSRTPL